MTKLVDLFGARIAFAVVIFFPLSDAIGAVSITSLSEKIRVRINDSTPKAVIRGFDLQVDALSANRRSEWEFQCQKNRVQARILSGKIANQKGTDFVFEAKKPVMVQTPVGFLSYAAELYREELWVYPKGNTCEVVNRVDLEKYLDGLVNSEFSSKWNAEAIAAQVIAARTYAYFQMKEAKKKGSNFDVDASTRDQVYDGFRKEDYQASRIVQKTRGMVLVAGPSSHSAPIKAFYHSTCGGKTELPERVWGGAPQKYMGFKRSVTCPYCVVSPAYRWDLTLTQAELSDVIRTRFSISKEYELMEVRPVETNKKERISKLFTIWKSAHGKIEFLISSTQLRDWVGPTRFKSTAFEITPNPKEKLWTFRGRGNGHGVGMCQWGAKVMGEKGFGMASILKHYYPDAILKKLW
jgi:stage II sporulation protein D